MSNDPFAQFSQSLPAFPNAKCVDNLFHPDTWFPEAIRDWNRRDAETFVAKSICGGCVHRVECLQFALDNGIADGIWGGLLPEERQGRQVQVHPQEIRKQKLEAVRQRMAFGFSLADACADVGIHPKTFERYEIHEKNGWPKELTPKQRREKENK